MGYGDSRTYIVQWKDSGRVGNVRSEEFHEHGDKCTYPDSSSILVDDEHAAVCTHLM
jgi:hypothetical protein